METIVKIKNSSEGKKLLSHLRSLNYVEVLDESYDVIQVEDFKRKIRKAEKSKSIPLQESIRRSEQWKSRYK